MDDDHPPRSRGPLSKAACSLPGSHRATPEPRTLLSTFERIISTHPPVFESLLLQLPTSSILDLYHTSNYLRSFLQGYPIAWNNLSFRSLSPGRLASRQTSPASDRSGDVSIQRSKPYALDQLLVTIILPFGTRLRSLDLDHTAVSGDALTTCVLHGRRETIQHLSVRGCKQVSLKYNIVPFLSIFNLQKEASRAENSPNLALRSLYTFRCRHHRRRPYSPASLLRKDSDSAPTHDLIDLCHNLGIWTDTAWCPTPGGRCLRRKDYSVGRGTPDARAEVWVVFDRLWRSQNRLGRSTDLERNEKMSSRGQLWDGAESGYNGEALGCDSQPGHGEGKLLPAHLRQSHKKFVEGVKCNDCSSLIDERCEHCSIRMHCMGCRKTLCQNCAFARPLPQVSESADAPAQNFWWAPNQKRNPNAMLQEIFPSTTSHNTGNMPNSTVTPSVKMQWCCLRPMFSNGGSITFVGPGMTESITNHLRTAPLPKFEGYEDPEFMRLKQMTIDKPHVFPPKSVSTDRPDEVLRWLFYGPGSLDQNACPRNLCHECWNMPGWRAACQACEEPFCYAHDLRGLSVRICGYKDLASEKASLDKRFPLNDVLATWKMITTQLLKGLEVTELKTEIRETLRNLRMSSASIDKLANTMPSLRSQSSPWLEVGRQLDGLFTPEGSDISERKREEAEEFSQTSSCEPDTVSSHAECSDAKHDWRGCGALMCPKYRAIGDHRPKCPSAAQQCTLCDVHICPECLTLNPPCDCSYCKDHYRCPNCFHLLADLCKKAEETAEKQRRELEQELERIRIAFELRVYEEAVEKAGEFMAAMFEENERC